MTTKTTTQAVSLDAMVKQRRDALPEPVTFELFGVSFTLPPIKGLPMDVQERVGNSDVAMFRLVLGNEKVTEMIAAGITNGDLEVIAEEWRNRNGLESGESTASPSS